MRRAVVVVVVGLMTSMLAWGPPASAAPAEPANVAATLIDVDVFRPGPPAFGRGDKGPKDGGGKGGKPVPTTANCSNDGPTSAADYAFTGWVTAGGTAHLNTSTVPAGLPGAASLLQASFDAWSSGTGAPGFTVVGDGTVTRQEANRQNDLLFGRVSGGSIAVTYTWRWSDGLVESDIVFNRSLAWADLGPAGDGCLEDQPLYDFQGIATHEAGHVYGLSHPDGGRFETMYRYGYTGETLKRTPGAGDLAGIDVLY